MLRCSPALSGRTWSRAKRKVKPCSSRPWDGVFLWSKMAKYMSLSELPFSYHPFGCFYCRLHHAVGIRMMRSIGYLFNTPFSHKILKLIRHKIWYIVIDQCHGNAMSRKMSLQLSNYSGRFLVFNQINLLEIAEIVNSDQIAFSIKLKTINTNFFPWPLRHLMIH